jgi:hypothetical protein
VTLPTEISLAGVLWPPVILIIAILVFVLLKKRSLGSVTYENGKITVTAAQMNTSNTTRYHRDRRIAQIDRDLDQAARDITNDQKKPLKRALRSDRLCSAALSATVSDLLFQLYDAVNQNDFKHNLALERRDGYVADKVERIRREYEDFVEDGREAPCSDTAQPTVYPHWHEIEPHVTATVRAWAAQIAGRVVEACREKIEVYKEYTPVAEGSKDQYDLDILVDCISRNRGYIEAMGEKP